MSFARLALVLLALLLGANAASAAVAKGRNYGGTARNIALTPAQAKYTALTTSGVAARPSADKRLGYRSGWQVGYVKGTATKPVTAVALIYVYRTTAAAKHAYDSSCADCSGTYRTEGVSMKFQALANGKSPGVIDIATCRNVYVAIVVSGKTTSNALARAAGALAGGVYAKAMAGGMSSCKTG